MRDSSTEVKEPKVPSLWALFVAFLVVSAIWAINFFVANGITDVEERGVLGDLFGASNALFSGLALGGVIFAIFMQRSEIKIAKAELQYTKSIFQEQSDSLKLQNEETKKQIFENTFFQLLRVFTSLTDSLDLVSERGVTKGKDVLSAFEKRLGAIESGLKAELKRAPSFEEVFKRLYAETQNDLGHYFRMLYTILKYVDGAEVKNKKFYTNILRAQLSNSELHLLLYNGLSANGVEKLKPLIERYQLLDNLPLGRVRYKDALMDYAEEAFGENHAIKNDRLRQAGF